MVIFHGYVSLPEGKCLLMVNMMIDQSMELIIHPQKWEKPSTGSMQDPVPASPLHRSFSFVFSSWSCACHPTGAGAILGDMDGAGFQTTWISETSSVQPVGPHFKVVFWLESEHPVIYLWNMNNTLKSLSYVYIIIYLWNMNNILKNPAKTKLESESWALRGYLYNNKPSRRLVPGSKHVKASTEDWSSQNMFLLVGFLFV